MASFGIERLDHVSLNVSDRARAIEWYRDVLGLEQRNAPSADEEPVFMGPFGACIALFQAEAGTLAPRGSEDAGLRHVALLVSAAGLAKAQAHLRERDVDFRLEDHGSAHSLYFGDPDGNRIELTTYDV